MKPSHRSQQTRKHAFTEPNTSPISQQQEQHILVVILYVALAVLVVTMIFAVICIIVYHCSPSKELHAEIMLHKDKDTFPLAGSGRDVHGCLPSAGYQWNTTLQRCVRPWEVNTDT